VPIGSGLQGANCAARVFAIFEPLCAHELIKTGEVIKRYDPELSKLLRHILDLLWD
jgi:hypothetical protein